MHKVNVPSETIRTDLILEQDFSNQKNIKIPENKSINIIESNKEKERYTTIIFQDITEKEEYRKVEKSFKEVLKEYINPKDNDSYLVIGLGNPKSTPDSLGPKTIKEILVTRYLSLLGDLDRNIHSVSIFEPNVCGNTGIESVILIKKVIEEIKPTKVIVIDALKASHIERLVKTIQITNSGIHPGSGIFNDQGEISEKTMNCKIIAIGIPTVVDKNTMINKISNDNFMVTPTNIDFMIDRLSKLIGSTINHIINPKIFDK